MEFDLEAFQTGQKAFTREGHIATFIGTCDGCYLDEMLIFTIPGLNHDLIMTATLTGNYNVHDEESRFDLVSMVPPHQHLGASR